VAALPAWNTAAFGCIVRESVDVRSLLRTQLSGSFPAPFLSRSADSSAPIELSFGLDMSDAQFRAWQQWYVYDLNDGSLPFSMFLPWGTEQPSVRCRLLGDWSANRVRGDRWQVGGAIEIERESLPRFSGGAF